MPSRLYMPSTGLSVFGGVGAPAYDAGWNGTAAPANRRRLALTKENSPYATFTVTKSVANNPGNILLMSFITPTLADQTLSNTGFLKGVLQVSCSSAALASAQMIVKVWSHGAGALIGTPIAMHALAISNDFSTTLTNRKFPLNWGGSGAALTQVVIGDGNWIEIEIGARFYTAATGGTVSVRLGDPIADADLAENETDTTAGVPWFEFSQTLLWNDRALNDLQAYRPKGVFAQGGTQTADVWGPATFNNPAAQGGDLPTAGATTYFKMQQACTSSPSGYVTWVNTTGDSQGRPDCLGILGDMVEVARWSE